MIDLVSQNCVVCQEENKKTQPTYGLPGQRLTHCTKHKTDDMVNLKSQNCVVCASEGNHTFPCFGKPGQKRTHCTRHREEGMVNLKHKQCVVCESEKKSTVAYFALPGENPTHCKDHKEQGMVNVLSYRCAECNLVFVPHRGDLCVGCRLGTKRVKQLKLMVEEFLKSDIRTANFSYHDQYYRVLPKITSADLTLYMSYLTVWLS